MWQINTFIPYLWSSCPIRRQHFLHGSPPAVKGYFKYGIHAPERPSLRVAYHRIQCPIRAGNPAQNAPENLAYDSRLLETYGLADFAAKRPSELSGGMRQRAALIRTLVLRPELLLLDEPFSALDYQTRLNVSNDIGTILRQEHKTAILVTHDLSEAISMGDRVIVLSHRPGTIRSIIPISFEPGLTPLEKRNDSHFKSYFNLIWKEFNQNE